MATNFVVPKRLLAAALAMVFLISIPANYGLAQPVTPQEEAQAIMLAKEGSHSLSSRGYGMTQIALGQEHALAIDAEGNLWSWGWNSHGQLGLGLANSATRHTPTRVTGGASSWSSIAAGINQSFAIDTDGNLWAWGNGANGQLGLGNTSRQTTPQKIDTGSRRWATISAGRSHAVAASTDGSLWAWGSNADLQLGLGTNRADVLSPVEISGSEHRWRSVAAGDNFSLAIRSDGSLWSWGYNGQGQLGLGHTTDQQWIRRVGSDSNWTSVSAGWRHVLAIKTDGSLWAWGWNENGRLGDSTTTQQNSPVKIGSNTWQTISAGGGHSLAVDTKGDLYTWGRNSVGQLGLATNTQRTAPTRVVRGASKWHSVAAGWHETGDWQFSLATDRDGNLWSWGRDNAGTLGKGIHTKPDSRGTGTDNWAPWKIAASLVPTAVGGNTSGDWTPANNATVPNNAATNITSANTQNIVVNFNRPMRPDIVGSITVNQRAIVDVAAGTWSDSALGANTVFTAPLVLTTPGAVHTATVSGFVDAQFGAPGTGEMYPHSWTFTTASGGVTAPETPHALIKTVQALEGATLPVLKFDFVFAPVQIQLRDDSALVSRPVADVPKIISTISVGATDAVTEDGIITAESTLDIAALLEKQNYPGPGVYVWELSEVEGSSNIEPPFSIDYDSTQFQVRAFVDAEGSLSYAEAYELVPEGEELVLGGEIEEDLGFVSVYKKNVPLEVVKSISAESEFANLHTLFDFALEMEAHPLTPLPEIITATIVDSLGSPIAEDRGEVNIVDGRANFQLGHGERLVIEPLPVGTTFTVTEAAHTEYASSVSVIAEGNVILTKSGTHNTDLSTDNCILIDADENIVAFVSSHQFAPPETGLNISNSSYVVIGVLAVALIPALLASKRLQSHLKSSNGSLM